MSKEGGCYGCCNDGETESWYSEEVYPTLHNQLVTAKILTGTWIPKAKFFLGSPPAVCSWIPCMGAIQPHLGDEPWLPGPCRYPGGPICLVAPFDYVGSSLTDLLFHASSLPSSGLLIPVLHKILGWRVGLYTQKFAV